MLLSARNNAVTSVAITQDRGFWVLFACLFNNGVSNSMLFAILPAFAVEVGLPAVAVGATYIVAAFLFTIMSQVWGGLSDQYGRKPLMVIGLLGAAVSMWAMAETIGLARAGVVGAGLTAAMLIGSRAIFGLLNSAVGPGAQAWVADQTAPADRTRSIALLTSAFGLGAACGPMIAAQLTPWTGYAGPFVITGIVAILGALAVRAFVTESIVRSDVAKKRPGVIAQLKHAGDVRLRHILLNSMFMWIVQAAALQTIGFLVMDRMGVSADASMAMTGLVLTCGALAALFAQLVVIPRLDLRPRRALVAGGFLTILGALIVTLAPMLFAIVIGFVALSLGVGLARPGASAAASLAVEPQEQGMAAGLVAASAGVGFFLSPIIGTGFYMISGGAGSFAVMAVTAIVATIIAVRSATIADASARADADIAPAAPKL